MPIIQFRMKFQNNKGENMMRKENRPGAPTPGRENTAKHPAVPYRPLYYIGYGRRMQQEKEKKNAVSRIPIVF